MANKDRSYYEGMLDEPNVQRALGAIRQAEGTAKKANPYAVGFGFTSVSDLSKHPGQTLSRGFTDKTGKKNKSSAAGAYQFVDKTWSRVSKDLSLPDFSPRSQDIAAVALIDGRKALGNVLSGDIKGFASKVKSEWASFPASEHKQRTVSNDAVARAWANTNVPNEAVAPRRPAPSIPTPTFMSDADRAIAMATQQPRPQGPIQRAAPVLTATRALALNTAPTPTRVAPTRAIALSPSTIAPAARAASVTPAAARPTLASVKAPVSQAKVGQPLTAAKPVGVTARAAPVATRSIALNATVPSAPAKVASREVTAAEMAKGPRLTSTLNKQQETNLASRLDLSTPKVAAVTTKQPASALAPAAPKTGAVQAINSMLSGRAPAPVQTSVAPAPKAASVAPTFTSALSPVAARPANVSPVDRQAVAVNTAKPAAVASTAAPAVRGLAETFDFNGVTPKQREQAIASIASRPKVAPEAYQTPAFSTAKPRLDAFGQPPISGLQPYKAPAPVAPAALAPLPAPQAVPQRKVATAPVSPVTQPRVQQPVQQPVVRQAPVMAYAPTPVQRAPAPVATRSIALGAPAAPAAPQQSALARMGAILGNVFGGGPAPSQEAKAAMAMGFDGFSHAGTAAGSSSGSRSNSGGLGGASSGPSSGVGGNGSNFSGSSFGGGRNATGGNNNTSGSKSSGKKK